MASILPDDWSEQRLEPPETFPDSNKVNIDSGSGLQSMFDDITSIAITSHRIQTYLKSVEGRRIRDDSDGAIYLVLDGKARQVANMSVYNGMFGHNYNFTPSEIPFSDMPRSPPITAEPPLIYYSNCVFLVDEGKKRHIATKWTFEKFGFDWSRLSKQPYDQYPEGQEIRL